MLFPVMDPDSRKLLRQCFSAELKRAAPDFKEEKLKSKYLVPGDRVFVRKASSAVWLFVILIPHHAGGRKFSIEVGWSRLARFPESSVRPSPKAPEEAVSHLADEYVCRVGKLSGEGDKWWMLPGPFDDRDLLKTKIEEVVREAVNDIVRLGLPYLDQLVGRIEAGV
jgi:hypothetical protein